MRRAFGGHNQLRAPANWTTFGDDATFNDILMTKMGKPALVATKFFKCGVTWVEMVGVGSETAPQQW